MFAWMMNQEELRKFTLGKLKKGYPEGELINDLLKEGYAIEDIKEAIRPASLSNNIENNDFPIWYLLSVGLFILGLTLIIVPIVWISSYGWFFLLVGFAGIILRFLRRDRKKQNKE